MRTPRKNASQGYNDQNEVELIRGGKAYFDLLIKLIDNATESIHLQTYIYDTDETGMRVADALKAAAQRKVTVHLLADGYASKNMSRSVIKDLTGAGIHFRFFEPLLKSKYFYFGRRMHHKIFVVDAKFALVGGVNITNRYNDMPDQPAWLDFAVFCQGEVARELCIICWKSWKGFPAKKLTTPCEKMEPVFDFKHKQRALTRVRRNDWVRRKKEISASYVEMCNSARSHITIICSYFLPGKLLRHTLKEASQRGVRIKVVIAGRSDVGFSKSAERWLYDWLLRNKIELYEYQPTVLHAKVAAYDSEWATIGSYNLNNLSAYTSIELNLDINNKAFATTVEKTVDDIIQKDCVAITWEEYKKNKNIFKQFIRWCSYEIIRLILYMVTFYYKQR